MLSLGYSLFSTVISFIYLPMYKCQMICICVLNVNLYSLFMFLSYDDASCSEIMPCNKIDKPLVVYRFMENVMTSITTLRTL